MGEAALGIAMANADPSVLALADHVAPHHAEDGFATAVEQLLKGELVRSTTKVPE